MTKAEIKKMIAEYEWKIADEKTTETVMEEIYAYNNGKDYAVPTGEYRMVKQLVAGPNEKAYRAKIAELAHELYMMDEDKRKKEEDRRKREKVKRYRKELAELEDRKAYLEKWLAENE